MKKKQRVLLLALACLMMSHAHAAKDVQPQTTAFAYQGQLLDGAGLVNASGQNFTFTLFDVLAGGNPVITPRANPAIVVANVTDGLFSVDLDYGLAFAGAQYYLEVAVGSGADAHTLIPRQSINTVPVAQYALSAPGSSGATGPAGGSLAGSYPNPVIGNTGVLPGSYGDAGHVPTLNVGADGRLIAVGSAVIAATPTGSAGGSLTGSYPDPTLAASGVSANSYGDATDVARFTVGTDGRITSASSVPIASPLLGGAAGGALAGTYPNPSLALPVHVPFSTSLPSVSYYGLAGVGTNGIWERVEGASLSPTTRNFNFGVFNFPGVNLPGDVRQNTVVSLGWNVGANGAREDVSDSSFRIAFEEHYLQGGIGIPANEFHVESTDTNGVPHRIISTYAPKDGGGGSSLSFASDIVNFSNYAGVEQIDINAIPRVVSFPHGDYIFQWSNNAQVLQQQNAAGTAFVSLPFVDADDRIRIGASFGATGATPTSGSYPNTFFAIAPSAGLAAGGSIIQTLGPSVGGSYYGINDTGASTGDFILAHYNNTSAPTANAVIELRTIGATAGDPKILFNVNGSTQWQVGQHNGNNHAFVFATATFGAGGDVMTLSTAGDLSLQHVGAGVRVREGNNAKQGTVLLAAGIAIVANTSITGVSRIFVQSQADGGAPGFLRISSRVPGTSFTITSSSATDHSTVAYEIFEPSS